MGAWGAAIFSDDLALDVKGEYYALLMSGQSDEEAEKAIIDKYSPILKETEDEPVFWFALALSQWKKGRLSSKVKEQAISFVENGKDLERWDEPDNHSNFRKRKKALIQLKEKLESEMPVRKELKKPSVVHSPWKAGDLLAYRIEYSEIKYPEFLGKYVLLRVLKVLKHSVSIYLGDDYYNETVLLGLYNWSGDEIPDKNIVDSLDYAIIADYVDPVFGRRIETCMNLDFEKKEIKTKNIIVLGNDPMYEKNIPDFFRTRYNQYNWYWFHTMDTEISIVLHDQHKKD